MIKQVGVEAALEFINMPPGNVIYIHEDGKIETKSDVYMDSNKNSYSHASDHDLSASLANLSKLSNNSSNSNLSGIASSNSSCSNNSAKWGMNLTFQSSHRQKDGADFQGAVLSKNVPNFNGKNSNFDANALHNRLGGDSKTASHLSCADFEKFLSMIPPKPNNVQPSIGGGGSLGNHSNFNMSQNRIATNQYVPAVALGKFNPNIRSNLDRQVSGFAHDGGNGNVLVNAPRNQYRNASYSNSIAQSRPEHEHFNLDGNQQYTGNKYENMQPVSSSPNDRSVVYGHPYRPVVSTQISHRNQSSDTDIYNGYFASISSNGTAQPMLQPPPPPLHNRGYHGSGERGGVPTRPVHVQRNNQMMQVNWDTPQMHQSNSFNQGPVISHAVVYNNQPEPSILSRRANRDVFFENQAQPSNHIPQINRGAGHKVQTQSISQRQAGDVSCNNQVQPVNHGLLLSRLSPTTKSAFPPTSVSTSNYYNTVSISNAKRTQETVMQGVWDSLPSDSSNTMPSSDLHKCRSNMEVENLMSSNEYSLSMNGSPGLHSVADVELGSNDSTRGMH